MSLDDVQTLVLRPARAAAVAHLVLRVTPGHAGEARRLLARALHPGAALSVGVQPPAADQLQCSLGFSHRGLQALGMPSAYLRLLARLAPAFAQGAPLRAAALGDSGASAPVHWNDGFHLDAAHVLLTLHGPVQRVQQHADALQALWNGVAEPQRALACVDLWRGQRLGAPSRDQQGEWVHFGYRDGLTDHRIEGVARTPRALPITVLHAPGEFVLGHANDCGSNPFGLPSAPDEVRRFFRNSSFGVLRPMLQDVAAFDAAVRTWCQQAQAVLGAEVSTDWIRAKLCGRWPSGEALRPGQWQPAHGDFGADFAGDGDGSGCPWATHVRRMKSTGPDPVSGQRERPLVRRGMPFGAAVWHNPDPTLQRGLLGLFFCASIEDQFEHLLGQWANRRPLGSPDASPVKDPLIGQHEDSQAAMLIPRKAGAPLVLKGFAPWTRTLGTLFAWHPSGQAVQRILQEDYQPLDESLWL